jgi:LPXTG-motif cell wall-anchored protein
MKLRRALAAAAATAAIAPLALLSAPAAFASDNTSSPSTSVSPTDTSFAGASTSASTSASASQSASSSASASTSASASQSSSPSSSASSPAPSTSAPEGTESPEPEPSLCEDTKVDVTITGLPGKIAAGSGWHKFSLNVANNSGHTLQDLDFFAGASADKAGENLFTSKQVQLQAWNPEDNVWENLNDGGYAVGYVGYTDELKSDYEVNVPLRINVAKSAPVGAGFSLGATIYADSDANCTGAGEVSYKFQIVSPGTDTDGTKPQEGGKAPVTSTKPSSTTPKVTGTLASTGSSSALPTIALVGGVAVVAGGGVVFAVRRRKAGGHAAA